MRHDPELVAEVRAWLTKAAADLRAAEHDLRASPPLAADVVYHCQQAAEKALIVARFAKPIIWKRSGKNVRKLTRP